MRVWFKKSKNKCVRERIWLFRIYLSIWHITCQRISDSKQVVEEWVWRLYLPYSSLKPPSLQSCPYAIASCFILMYVASQRQIKGWIHGSIGFVPLYSLRRNLVPCPPSFEASAQCIGWRNKKGVKILKFPTTKKPGTEELENSRCGRDHKLDLTVDSLWLDSGPIYCSPGHEIPETKGWEFPFSGLSGGRMLALVYELVLADSCTAHIGWYLFSICTNEVLYCWGICQGDLRWHHN